MFLKLKKHGVASQLFSSFDLTFPMLLHNLRFYIFFYDDSKHVVHFLNPVCFLFDTWSTLGVQIDREKTHVNSRQRERAFQEIYIHILRFTPVYSLVPIQSILRHRRECHHTFGGCDVRILHEVWTRETISHAHHTKRVSPIRIHAVPRLSNRVDGVSPRVLSLDT